MSRVTLQELGEGMVTEEAVLDDLGNVVLREGVKLTARMIEALRNRGVNSILVNGGANADAESALSKAEKARMCRQINEKIDGVFSGHAKPLMLELAEASKRFLKGKIK